MPRKILLATLIGAVIIIALVLAAYFQDYVSTKAIGPSGSPVTVRQGQTIRLKIATSAVTPSVKIELCQLGSVSPCQVLDPRALTAQTQVRIPEDFPTGQANVKILERDVNGILTGEVLYERPVTVTPGSAWASALFGE